MPLNVAREREDSTLGGQHGDEATSSNVAKLQAVLDFNHRIRRQGPALGP